MAEKKRETRAARESEGATSAHEEKTDTAGSAKKGTPAMKQEAFAPAVPKRISWGSLIAGVSIAIATQLVVGSVSVFTGFGMSRWTSIVELKDVATGIGVWATVSILIADFIGAFVASRLAGARLPEEGLWMSIILWALVLISSILLSTFGVSGFLGFVGSPVSALRIVAPSGAAISQDDIKMAAGVAVTLYRYFLIGSLLSFVTALFGGWFGLNRFISNDATESGNGFDRMAA